MPGQSPGISAEAPRQMMRTASLVDTTLGRKDALALTDQIKGAADRLWELLLEAHERRAWNALGYRGWGEYIEGEFQHTRRWGYRLVDQGIVIRAIQEAAGVCPKGHISERVARDIKPHLAAVTQEIRERVTRGDEPEVAVKETVAAVRAMATPRVNHCSGETETPEQFLGGLVIGLRAAALALVSLVNAPLSTDVPAQEWIKRIDTALQELRACRARLGARS